jgi:hypothetical protein
VISYEDQSMTFHEKKEDIVRIKLYHPSSNQIKCYMIVISQVMAAIGKNSRWEALLRMNK